MAKVNNNKIVCDCCKAIYLALKNKEGNELKETLQAVVKFLHRRCLLVHTEEILSELKKIINQENKVVEATVTSTENLGEAHRRELIHWLREKYSAKEVELTEKTEKGLLAGFKIEVGDELIDLSASNKLKKLKEHLINS